MKIVKVTMIMQVNDSASLSDIKCFIGREEGALNINDITDVPGSNPNNVKPNQVLTTSVTVEDVV